MDKINRRQLLRESAAGAGAVALGVLGAGASAAFADDDDDEDGGEDGGGLHVHVHGNLRGKAPTPSTVRLAVSFDVYGRSSNLAGAGWDGGTGTNPNATALRGPLLVSWSSQNCCSNAAGARPRSWRYSVCT